jgi:hypothetical protein
MSKLIRFTYASRSTSPPEAQVQGLDLGVARILAKSRKNNRQRQIVGGLLFGDGRFLQCLEGEEEAVLTLYKKIEADPRHRDVTELARVSINERTFGEWSMKYVPGERALGDLMRGWGMPQFNPYVFSPEQLGAAITYLRQQADAARQLPDDEQLGRSKRQAPQSYIGKNIPRPAVAVKSAGILDKGPVQGIAGRLKWVMMTGGAVAMIGVLLYFSAR